MCDCFVKIQTDLKNKYGESFSLNTHGHYGYVFKNDHVRLIVPFPMAINDDHALGPVIGCQHFITALYCPFCGKKL